MTYPATLLTPAYPMCYHACAITLPTTYPVSLNPLTPLTASLLTPLTPAYPATPQPPHLNLPGDAPRLSPQLTRCVTTLPHHPDLPGGHFTTAHPVTLTPPPHPTRWPLASFTSAYPVVFNAREFKSPRHPTR